MPARRVLILCTGNSCRSQMAEALWRHLADAEWEVHSAGTRPAGYVHPAALAALAELGIHAADARSKSLDEFVGQHFDLVITVCSSAARDCPTFHDATRILHWPCDDPAAVAGDNATVTAAFRRVRDEIHARIASFLRS